MSVSQNEKFAINTTVANNDFPILPLRRFVVVFVYTCLLICPLNTVRAGT